MGSFSVEDSYGIKKVTSRKNSHFSNLFAFIPPRSRRIYPVFEFLGTALKFIKREKISSMCVHAHHNASHLRKFRSWSCSDSKKMYQTVCWTCKLLFCLSNLFVSTFSLPSPSLLLGLSSDRRQPLTITRC